MSTIMYGQEKSYTKYFNSINEMLYTHYNAMDEPICESNLPTLKYCAFSNLTNAQWLNEGVLANPLTD